MKTEEQPVKKGKAAIIREYAKVAYSEMMAPLAHQISLMAPAPNEQKIKEMLNNRAKMAINAGEIFYNNWELLKGKFIE